MMRLLRPALLLLMLASLSAQADPPADLVKAELLADVSAIAPGKAFTLGVRMKMEPGWHTYWKNPGDSGAPTKIAITAPEGFSVEPIQFPTPVQFNQPGDIVGYGYTEEVMLTARVTPPADLKPGDSVDIKAVASWLCCEAVCVPGKQNLAISLPTASASSPANQELFEKWLAMIPAEKSDAIEAVTPVLSSDAEGGLKSAQITVNWKAEPKDVHFFPAKPSGYKVENVEVKTEGKTTTVSFSSRRLPGAKPATQPIEAVVAYSNDAGERRGIVRSIPIQNVVQNNPVGTSKAADGLN